MFEALAVPKKDTTGIVLRIAESSDRDAVPRSQALASPTLRSAP